MSYITGQVIDLNYRPGFYVYGLLDDDGIVFYVGKTNNPRSRLGEHLRGGTEAVRARLRTLNEPRLQILGGPFDDFLAQKIENICIQGGALCGGLLNAAEPKRADYITRLLR